MMEENVGKENAKTNKGVYKAEEGSSSVQRVVRDSGSERASSDR